MIFFFCRLQVEFLCLPVINYWGPKKQNVHIRREINLVDFKQYKGAKLSWPLAMASSMFTSFLFWKIVLLNSTKYDPVLFKTLNLSYLWI